MRSRKKRFGRKRLGRHTQRQRKLQPRASRNLNMSWLRHARRLNKIVRLRMQLLHTFNMSWKRNERLLPSGMLMPQRRLGKHMRRLGKHLRRLSEHKMKPSPPHEQPHEKRQRQWQLGRLLSRLPQPLGRPNRFKQMLMRTFRDYNNNWKAFRTQRVNQIENEMRLEQLFNVNWMRLEHNLHRRSKIWLPFVQRATMRFGRRRLHEKKQIRLEKKQRRLDKKQRRQLNEQRRLFEKHNAILKSREIV